MRLVSSNLANYHATVHKLLVELRLVTDRRTDGRTDTGPWLVPRMRSIAR